jgi:hypothetical protein
MLAEIERRSFTYRSSPTRIKAAEHDNEAGVVRRAAYPPPQVQVGSFDPHFGCGITSRTMQVSPLMM